MCAQKGQKEWIGVLLGCSLSILGLLIIKWFFKVNLEGMSCFYRKKHDLDLMEEPFANIEAERLGITIEEYWEKNNYDTRKSDYENRDKRKTDVAFGDEGMSDKHGNTWVDYFSYIVVGLIILMGVISQYITINKPLPPPSKEESLWDILKDED